MTIYQEILDWSQNKPYFLKDSLRRLITSSIITSTDIEAVYSLLKKENGDSSISLEPLAFESSHIPSLIPTGNDYPTLKSIKEPINICALHSEADLQFADNGLTVIYGGNGSGKSSYSRILKKVCWSRNPSIELKKNIFTPSEREQKVGFIIKINGSETNFQWTENHPPHPALNSIYLFDTHCGEIYINKENPTEYKPIGIDLLERLIEIFNKVSQEITTVVGKYNTPKPILNNELNSTRTGQWYLNIEQQSKEEVDAIDFNENQIDRKQNLTSLLSTPDPDQALRNLVNKKGRMEAYGQQFRRLEEVFNEENVSSVQELRRRYESTKMAYDLAKREMEGLNILEGFGTDPWRTLWEAANNFARSNGMTDGINYPSKSSLEKCVLCQQELNDDAKKRLLSFNTFIINDVSTQLKILQREIREKISDINLLNVPPFENYTEINDHIQDFENLFMAFNRSIHLSKTNFKNYLQDGGELKVEFPNISIKIEEVLKEINEQIKQTRDLIENRNALTVELNDLRVREFLFNNKASIVQYYSEHKYKTWLQNCQSQLNTSIISRKIGEIMENQAVNLQHQEFIRHLSYFNQELASKVLLTKTRTSQGNTFQKCSLDGLSDPIHSVLSEGEQKIIAISNFLAESTIDGRKNSIIFDDPVTSLDMDYRELITNKIVELSGERQVIVFTHDLSFLRMLIDKNRSTYSNDCQVLGIVKDEGISGIVSDEIPYLAKNVQERIDSIRRIISDYDRLDITDTHGREVKLDAARKRFRMLLERSVEELLSSRTYERFSKNIHVKKGNLTSYIITEQSDVDLLLDLYAKYSIPEHDGGTSTIPQLPSKTVIESDLRRFSDWKKAFQDKLKLYKVNYN